MTENASKNAHCLNQLNFQFKPFVYFDSQRFNAGVYSLLNLMLISSSSSFYELSVNVAFESATHTTTSNQFTVTTL